jgi:fucose permease
MIVTDFIPEAVVQRTELNQENTFKHIFRQKFIHAMAIFILVYVGVEVTIG